MSFDPSIRPFLAASSGEQDSSVAIDTEGGCVTGAVIIADGTNPATCILYDSLGTSGTKIFQRVVSSPFSWNPLVPINYDTGLYLTISGTNASAIVHYISR